MLTMLCVGIVAAVLLFWGLTDKYLWQDEAATAVMARNMLRTGKPLAYDGRNLITIDNFAAEDPSTIGERTTSAQAALDYYVARGDFRADTAWTFQPWGQFVAAAAGLLLIGETTLGARLPFALAALLTVLLLYRLAKVYCGSTWIASLASLLLLCNTYWILHARQSRYYALSSLFLVVTLMAYLRWQRGRRWGAAAFVAAAWCWFQMDYGTVWPVFGVLFASAMASRRHSLLQIFVAGTVLAVSIAPFVFFYRLSDRGSVQIGTVAYRIGGNFFNINQYVIPGLILLVAIAVLAHRWKSLPEAERHLLLVCCTLPVALGLWVTRVAPDAYVRYVVMAAPIGCLVAAWAMVHLAGPQPQLAVLGAAVLALTPWFSVPLLGFVTPPRWIKTGSVLRSELPFLVSEVFGHRPDPNRIVVEWLRQNAAPSDEILVNYEDVPLMFYLPNPIRGGIPAFRAEDDAITPPRFAVIRRNVSFLHWPVFTREIARYQWELVPLDAPDVFWGNNPDPMGYLLQDPKTAKPLFIARRID